MLVHWIDDNHMTYSDDNGDIFSVTVRPKESVTMKARLYWFGPEPEAKESDSPRVVVTQKAKWFRENIVPSLNKALGGKLDYARIKFSSKAGCSCGCSPGFIIEGPQVPFNIFVEPSKPKA